MTTRSALILMSVFVGILGGCAVYHMPPPQQPYPPAYSAPPPPPVLIPR